MSSVETYLEGVNETAKMTALSKQMVAQEAINTARATTFKQRLYGASALVVAGGLATAAIIVAMNYHFSKEIVNVPVVVKEVVKVNNDVAVTKIETVKNDVVVTKVVEKIVDRSPIVKTTTTTDRPDLKGRLVTDFTVFKNVSDHGVSGYGEVTTGHKYRDTTDTKPGRQYCYASKTVNGDSVRQRVDLANVNEAGILTIKDVPESVMSKEDFSKLVSNCVFHGRGAVVAPTLTTPPAVVTDTKTAVESTTNGHKTIINGTTSSNGLTTATINGTAIDFKRVTPELIPVKMGSILWATPLAGIRDKVRQTVGYEPLTLIGESVADKVKGTLGEWYAVQDATGNVFWISSHSLDKAK